MSGISTQLIGPYDAWATHDKIRITCGVPEEIQSRLFDKIFTRRGAQDKILARLFHIFVVELNTPKALKLLEDCVTEEQREALANEILNKIANHGNTYTDDIDAASGYDSDTELHGSPASPPSGHGPKEANT